MLLCVVVVLGLARCDFLVELGFVQKYTLNSGSWQMPALQIDLIEKHKQRFVVVAVVAQASGCRLGSRCRRSDRWSESWGTRQKRKGGMAVVALAD